MRHAQHVPRYSAKSSTVTLHARAQKNKRRRATRSRRHATRPIALALTLLLAISAAGFGAYRLVLWLHRSPEYIVQQIAVEGACLLMPEEVIALAELEPGQPILDYPIIQARRKLLGDPRIKKAAVTRRLPNQIVIRVVERVPIARLALDRHEFLVDCDGFLLTECDGQENLPLIKGVFLKIEDPKTGKRIRDEKLDTGLQILRLCRASSIPSLMPIDSVDVRNPSNVQLRSKVGPKTPHETVFLLGNGDFGQRLARLEKMLHHLTQIGKRKVDLRLERVAL